MRIEGAIPDLCPLVASIVDADRAVSNYKNSQNNSLQEEYWAETSFNCLKEVMKVKYEMCPLCENCPYSKKNN